MFVPCYVVDYSQIQSTVGLGLERSQYNIRSLIIAFFLSSTRTGPASQVNFMGYAKQSQTAHGIHMRLRSRAFIFAEYDDKTLGKSDENLKKESIFSQSQRLNVEGGQTQKGTSLRRIGRSNHRRPIDVEDFGDSTSRLRYVCFVSIDAGMGSNLLNQKVMKRLDELILLKTQATCVTQVSVVHATHTFSTRRIQSVCIISDTTAWLCSPDNGRIRGRNCTVDTRGL